jgi:hypothetical protein
VERNPRTNNDSLTVGLALLAGAGFMAMVFALALGMIEGAEADSDVIGLIFLGGLAVFISGAVAWGAIMHPWEAFDDINVPLPDEHHHDKHEEETAEAHAS